MPLPGVFPLYEILREMKKSELNSTTFNMKFILGGIRRNR